MLMGMVRVALLASFVALSACGGQESGESVDASIDAPAETSTDAHADAFHCPVHECTPDPSRPVPGFCCTEACTGAPCTTSDPPSCFLPCSDTGLQGKLYCGPDGTWQAGLGLFPCGPADAGADAPTCSIGDALVSDASCSATDAGEGCGVGEVCAVEVGGPMRRGATWCVTIPPECGGTPTCACMGVCACGHWRCVDGPTGEIFCDDGTI